MNQMQVNATRAAIDGGERLTRALRARMKEHEMSVRAKFKCTSKTSNNPNDPETRDVRFDAVNGVDGEGNKDWSRWTPSGQLTMQITNPGAHEQFVEGKEYFLDFTAAE